MDIRLSLAAVATLAVLSGPALALQQVTIPDSSAAASSAPPDALFDKSVPTTWEKKAEEKQNTSGFHFSAGSGRTDSTYNAGGSSLDQARTPGSEFSQSRPAYNDPFAQPQ